MSSIEQLTIGPTYKPAPGRSQLLLLQPTEADTTKPPSLTAAVIGGSIGGLCTAIALTAAGIKVQLFERATGQLWSQGAGIVAQPDMINFLEEYGVADQVGADGVQFVHLPQAACPMYACQ